MATKRKDKSRVVLKTGEVQRKDGTYQFSWQDSQMKRRFVYARTLDDLREKEKRIQKDKCDGIKTEARYTTIDELFDLWANMKRGLKNNTFENYKYIRLLFVQIWTHFQFKNRQDFHGARKKMVLCMRVDMMRI